MAKMSEDKGKGKISLVDLYHAKHLMARRRLITIETLQSSILRC